MRKTRTIVVAFACSAFLLTGGAYAAAIQDSAAPPTAADAQNLQQSGLYEEAAAAWQAVLEANPENATAWFNLGYSLHMTGDYEAALRAHRKAATYDQFKGIALFNVACANALMGNTDAALEALAASKAAGFDRIASADTDSDLDSIRSDPRYAVIMGRAPAATQAPARVRVEADTTEPAAPSQPRRMTMSRDAINAGRQRLPQLFQTVADHMQPIIEELAPEIEERAEEIAEIAMNHLQQLMGQFHQMVSQDDELMSAIQEIHQTLSNDPEFMQFVQQAQQWFEHRTGGGRPQAGAGAMRPAVAAPATAVRAPAADQAQPAATESAARQLQNSGEFAAAAAMFDQLRKQDPHNAQYAFGYAYNLHMSGEHAAAIEAHAAAAQFEEVRGISLYNLACALALTGHPDAAMEALNASVEAGFDVAGFIADDADLDSLREDPRFIELRKKLGDG